MGFGKNRSGRRLYIYTPHEEKDKMMMIAMKTKEGKSPNEKAAKTLMDRRGLWAAYMSQQMTKWDQMGLKEKRMTWSEISLTERYSLLYMMDAEEAEIYEVLLKV